MKQKESQQTADEEMRETLRPQSKMKHLSVAILLTSLFMCVYNNFFVVKSRRLSIYDPNSIPVCKWEPPQYDIPDENDWYKTVVVGFPSGDKRMAYMQMEALTGWAAKDEWAYTYLGMSNHPFIKSNFPHHDGIWSWEGKFWYHSNYHFLKHYLFSKWHFLHDKILEIKFF